MKIIITLAILAVGILFTILSFEQGNYKRAILGIIATIALNIVSNLLYSDIELLFSKKDESSMTMSVDETPSNNEDNYMASINAINIEPDTDVSGVYQHDNQQDPSEETISQEIVIIPNYIEDISGSESVGGSIVEEGQKDIYKYVPTISGGYRFDTDLSSGGSVVIRISGENEDSINYGYDALTIDLEAGKTYLLSVEYRNGYCDYIVNVGVPVPVNDISDNLSSVVGSIAYQDQKNKYYFTASVTGTYRFDTDLSSGGSVIVRISGENGKSINYGYDALTIDLEAGKKYILSIEYRNDICDYIVNIGVPVLISDISENPFSVAGSITYQDQKNKYYYTAPVTGTYRFETNLSSGGAVIVRISGENGKPINYGYDALTIDLEAGKKYILSIEYRDGTCDYIMNTGIPIPITDVTSSSSIVGNITYQDQKDRYYYTAPITGTYNFETNLSSGGSVIVRISGENGKSINYSYNTLTIDLEAGKKYILSIEYRQAVCTYETFIHSPL